MKVTTVTATLRYSAEAKGAWRSIEVGAEATLTTSDESWETVQAELYHRLGQQLKTLWSNGSKAEAHEQPQAETPAPPKEHWCSDHGVSFVARKGKNGTTFYSHRQGDGWHNEK